MITERDFNLLQEAVPERGDRTRSANFALTPADFLGPWYSTPWTIGKESRSQVGSSPSGRRAGRACTTSRRSLATCPLASTLSF
jgi:hypothetical protein